MNKVVLLFLFGCGVIFGQWENVGQMPYAVAGADAISPDGVYIYLFGGYSDSTQSNVKWIQVYNTLNQSWSFAPMMQAHRSGLVVSQSGSQIYYFGGVTDTTDSANTIESWSLSGSPINYDYNDNFARINSSGLILNNIFYVFGGNPYHSQITVPYLFAYDLSSKQIIYSNDTLFLGGNLPEQQMVANINKDIYIFGGVINGVSKKIYKFDTNNKTFELLNATLGIPTANGRAVSDVNSNKIYILGGYSEQRTALNSVEIFTVSGQNYTVEPGPSLNIPRKNFSAVFCSGYIYVFGGYDEFGNLVKEIERFGVTVSVAGSLKPEQKDFQLYQNYPNPFNPSTNIHVSISRENGVKLNIYDIDGRLIRNLINENLSKGDYYFVWNGKDNKGKNVSSGVYFYSLNTNGFVITKKMLLLK